MHDKLQLTKLSASLLPVYSLLTFPTVLIWNGLSESSCYRSAKGNKSKPDRKRSQSRKLLTCAYWNLLVSVLFSGHNPKIKAHYFQEI